MQDLTLNDQYETLDPAHKAIAQQITNTLLVAADRAVLHTANPTKYPIDTTPGSVELALANYFKTRPAAKQTAAEAKTLADLGTPARTARLGVLADLDLTSAKPVFELAQDKLQIVPMPALRKPPAAPSGQGASAADDANAVIRCRIRKVTCVDRTDPDIGDDDMIVGGAFTNDKGKAVKIGQMTLGEFNEDDMRVKTYSPPMLFSAGNLAAMITGKLESSSWPKAYLATIVLCEQDNGGFPDMLKDLLDMILKALGKWAATELGSSLGAAIGTAVFPGIGTVIGTAIGAVVGFIVDGLVAFLKSWWEDDPLPAFTTSCVVNRYHTGEVTSSSVQHWDIKGQGGEYKVELDWQVNWPTHFADKIDATVNLGNGKAYFFAGKQYLRYDLAEDRVDDGYPKSISAGWHGLWNDLDAAVMWTNGKVYFFKGNEYMRFDASTKKMDAGYPKKIEQSWKGLFTDGIDAAMVDVLNNKAYFFKGAKYIRYDIKADHADPGYPLTIAPNWHGIPWSRIDTVLTAGSYAYFFHGDSYIRYNLLFDKTDAGVLHTDYYWPGL
jgi:hypothetical protein